MNLSLAYHCEKWQKLTALSYCSVWQVVGRVFVGAHRGCHHARHPLHLAQGPAHAYTRVGLEGHGNYHGSKALVLQLRLLSHAEYDAKRLVMQNIMHHVQSCRISCIMVGHAEYHASWLVMQNIKHHGMPPISSLSDRPQHTYSRLVRIHTYINGDIISIYLSVPYIHTQTLSLHLIIGSLLT